MIAAAAAAALMVGGFIFLEPPTSPSAAAAGIQPVDAPTDTSVLVFVSGAVEHPGLYRLSPDARIADAIAAAGGILPNADMGKLPDLAAKVHDGKQINVPFAKGSSSGAAVVKVDVNSAGIEELSAIPGMPAGLPQAIIDYRSQYGPFASLAEMRDVLGVDHTLMTGLSRYLVAVQP